MASETITFYDLASKLDPAHAGTANTLKTTIALRFKGLPFDHKRLPFPDVASTLKSLGAKPYPPKGYTCPAISTPSHPAPLMESFAIAEYLEKTYPGTPALFPPGGKALAKAVQVYVDKHVFPKAGPIIMPRVPGFMDERSAEHFIRTREEMLGMSLKEFAAKADMDGFYAAFQGFDEMLKVEEGPFLLGETTSYGDMIILAFLQAFSNFDTTLAEKTMAVGDGNLKKLYEASKQWV